MKKIYIITFSHTTNVGAALQEYALYKKCKLFVEDTKVIDYIPKKIRKDNQIIRLKKDLMKQIILLPFNICSKYLFKKFSWKYINLTKKCFCKEEISRLEQPDIYIVGSDQIWNEDITGFDTGYLLDFNTNARKTAYAGSIGNDYLPKVNEKRFLELINKFDCLSVREKLLSEQLEEKGVQAPVVLDPTFLLEKEEYLKIASKINVSKYILIYETEKNPLFIKVARKIAQEKNLKIIQINRINNRYKVDKVIPIVSPQKFVALINNADYVLTNSFHGIAMSIILEKQFFYIKLKNRGSRIDNIINIGKLSSRVLYDEKDIIQLSDEKIDYSVVSERYKQERNNSILYLKEKIIEGK